MRAKLKRRRLPAPSGSSEDSQIVFYHVAGLDPVPLDIEMNASKRCRTILTRIGLEWPDDPVFSELSRRSVRLADGRDDWKRIDSYIHGAVLRHVRK